MTTTPSSPFLDYEYLYLTESFPFYHSGLYKQNNGMQPCKENIVVFPFNTTRTNP